MSGEIHGEVKKFGRELMAAGVTGGAWHALIAVAECCRAHNRIGPVWAEDVMIGLGGKSEASATRALRRLRELGLIELVRRPGGRGRQGKPAVYRIVPIEPWLAAVHGAERLGRHSDDDPMSGSGRRPDDDPMSDWVVRSAPLGRHPDDDLPGVPVTETGAASDTHLEPRQTSGSPNLAAPPMSPDRAAPSPRTSIDSRRGGVRPARAGAAPAGAASPPNAAMEPAPARARPVPAESWCRSSSCRAPDPCGDCGRARRGGAPAPVTPPTPTPPPFRRPDANPASDAARAAALAEFAESRRRRPTYSSPARHRVA